MDRPEWIASNPLMLKYIVHLPIIKTEVLRRIWEEEMPNLGPNPREKNQFGQIIKIIPGQMDHESNEFKWEILL